MPFIDFRSHHNRPHQQSNNFRHFEMARSSKVVPLSIVQSEVNSTVIISSSLINYQMIGYYGKQEKV